MTEKDQKKNILPVLVLLLLFLCGCGSAAAETVPEPQVLVTETPVPVLSLMLEDMETHPALMDTRGDGGFEPEEPVTKDDLYGLLAPLLNGLPDAGSDEPEQTLRMAGLLSETENDSAPEETLTRAELAHILLRLSEALPAEDGERAAALASDVLYGRTSQSGESAGEDEPILRAELAVVLVRLTGRTPDEAGLLLAGSLPSDVAPEDYAWAYIADAVTEGNVPAAEAGVHRAYGWLYAVWDDGTLVRNADYDVWSFAPDGRYTTGDAELDEYLRQALDEIGADGLDDESALQAGYLYVKYFGEYLVQPEDMTPLEPGAMGWEYDRALRFFRNGGGTCYGFAAAFGMLARVLGQEAYIVSAEVNQYHGAHAFVVIPEDGTDWIYDVELEATRQERHADLALYHMRNYETYFYWYDPVW